MSFVWKNWYKLAVIGLMLYIFFHKGLSFTLNLNAPFQTEEPDSKLDEQVPKQTKKSLGKLSDNHQYTVKPNKGNAPIDKMGLGTFTSETHTNDYKLLDQLDTDAKVAYLRRFSEVAISERKKYGIPSSIILASALLHSTAGENSLAQSGNNHFKLSCNDDWYEESGNYDGECYRHYKNAWSSFRDHSKYLTNGRFVKLRDLGSTGYEAWAKAMDDMQYSREKQLEEKLREIIHTYELYFLDVK